MVKTKERNTFLLVWLIIMLVALGLSLISNIVLVSTYGLLSEAAIVPLWTLVFSLIFTIINLILTILLFKWKKWAFFALCASAIIVFVVNMIFIAGWTSFVGLLGPVILYFAMRPNWKDFN